MEANQQANGTASAGCNLMWPFKEKRNTTSTEYTSRRLQDAADRVYSDVSDAKATAALEIASGLYQRGFNVATVTGARTEALTPQLLGEMARSCIRDGEHVSAITVSGGRLRLVPTGAHDVRGSGDPDTWLYRVEIPAPDTTMQRTLPYAAVVHVKYATDPKTPWRGYSPLYWADQTGTLAGNLERALKDETGGSTGWLLPVPAGMEADDDNDPLAGLQADLANLHGKLAVLESTTSGWGDKFNSLPAQLDFTPRRFGPSPPVTLPTLRDGTLVSILAACGIPPGLVQTTAGGASAVRESWRQFAHGSLGALARIFEAEFTEKLGTPIRIQFGELAAADIAGRGRTAGTLVKAGWTKEEAEQITMLRG